MPVFHSRCNQLYAETAYTGTWRQRASGFLALLYVAMMLIQLGVICGETFTPQPTRPHLITDDGLE